MELANLISQILLWVLVLSLAFLLLGSLRSQGLLSWRVTQLEATTPSRIGRGGLQPGKQAPQFTLPSVDGSEVSLGDFAGRKVLLVFVQTGCGPCHDIAPELNRLAARNGELQLLVVNNAEPEQAHQFVREESARFPVLIQDKWSVSKRYEVFATPFGFVIDEQGVVAAKGIVSSKEHLGYLLSSAANRSAEDRDRLSVPVAAGSGALHEQHETEQEASGNIIDHLQKELQHV